MTDKTVIRVGGLIALGLFLNAAVDLAGLLHGSSVAGAGEDKPMPVYLCDTTGQSVGVLKFREDAPPTLSTFVLNVTTRGYPLPIKGDDSGLPHGVPPPPYDPEEKSHV